MFDPLKYKINLMDLPPDFNPILYQKLNPDLSNLSTDELTNHYLRHGYWEKRKYNIGLPNNFDPLIYQKLNPDLSNLSSDELTNHYLKYGFLESRSYKYQNALHQKIANHYQTHNPNYPNVYIIGDISFIGGTGKYYLDLIEHYSNKNYMFINSNHKLRLVKSNLNPTDIIMIKSLLNTDIEISNLIDLLEQNQNQSILTIHDFMWLTSNVADLYSYNDYFHLAGTDTKSDQIQQIQQSHINRLFCLIKYILIPSSFAYNIYNKYFPNANLILINHPDYGLPNQEIHNLSIHNLSNHNLLSHNILNHNQINLFVPSRYTICKGAEYVNQLISNYAIYKNYNIRFYIIGDLYFNSIRYTNCINISEYDDLEFFDLIDKYNINGLIYLNKWAETWSYCLTKGLLSGLPLLYTKIGSYIERIDSCVEQINSDTERICLEPSYIGISVSDVQNQTILFNTFEKYLDQIIKSANDSKSGTAFEPAFEPDIYRNLKPIYPPFYDYIMDI